MLRERERLRGAGEALIARGHDAGGRDNVTVVLFRLEEVGAQAPTPATDGARHDGRRSPPTRRRRSPTAARGRRGAAAAATAARRGRRRRRARAARRGRRRAAAAPPARARRRAGGCACAARRAARDARACSALLGAGAYAGAQSVYFIGTDAAGWSRCTTGSRTRCRAACASTRATSSRASRRRSSSPRDAHALFDNELRSAGSAAALIRSLELGQLESRSPGSEPADRSACSASSLVMFALLRGVHVALDGVRSRALRANPHNKRARSRAAAHRARARSSPANGTVLARSVRDRATRAEAIYRRDYPFGDAVRAAGRLLRHRTTAHRARALRATAIWRADARSRARSSTSCRASATARRRGHHDARRARQQVAYAALAGARRRGGRDRPAHAARSRSSPRRPSYDPNALRPRPRSSGSRRRRRQPLVNRATQSATRPARRFKVVTAIAAIDTGAYTPELDGQRQRQRADLRPAARKRQRRRATARSRSATRWPIDQHRVGAGRRSVGAPTLTRYMNRLGFYRKPPDRPAPPTRCRSSGEYPAPPRLPPTSSRPTSGASASARADSR